MSISTVIKERRTKLGMTLADVASKMGVSEATVQRWESGTIKNLRHERIGRLAEVLGVSPAVLMGWEMPTKEESDSIVFLTLGNYIEYYRTTHKLSVQQFSEASGITSERIACLERGVDESTGEIVEPTVREYKMVAKGTGESFADVLAHVSNDFLESSGTQHIPHNSKLRALRREALISSGIPTNILRKVGRLLDLIGYDYEYVGINLVIKDGDHASRQITPEEYSSCVKEIERYVKYVVDTLAWDENQ